MRKSENVKQPPFIKFFLGALLLGLSPIPAPAVEIAPRLECGIYEASGKLKQDESDNFVLNLHGPNLYPYELLVVGRSVRDLRVRNGSLVKAQFYVPRKISHSPTPYVVLLKFLNRESLLEQHPEVGMEPGFAEPHLIKAHPCGDAKLTR